MSPSHITAWMKGVAPPDTMPGSFRDPAGCLFNLEDHIIRLINGSGEADLHAFLASATSQKFVEAGSLVRTDFLDPRAITSLQANNGVKRLLESGDFRTVVEHERVPFQSFPYEWPPEMLHAAAHLTLDLAEDLLTEGFGLKDATPYNVLFRGPDPVFIDLLSFERRNPCDPIWLAHAQFIRTFLLPLLVNKRFNLRLDQFLTVNRDGLEPEEVYRLCGPLQRLVPPFLTLVTLPSWLGAKNNGEQPEIYRQRTIQNQEKAQFILSQSFKRLRRTLEKVTPRAGRGSTWSDYMGKNNYTEDYFPEKQAFVEAALKQSKPKRVLDVGCNTGHFSALSAKDGASVVAIDYDPVVVGEVWRKAHEEALDILPLVVNLARPTPSVGWRNQECASFLERARGEFDAVLMLAVIHHMLVSERIPLVQILELAAELTTDILIIEFIGPDDAMFRRLTRGRDHLHRDLSVELFEDTCRQSFEIASVQRLGQTSRWIYLLRKRRDG